jgi:hypothetical protein
MNLFDVDKLDFSMGDDLHARYEGISQAYKFHKPDIVKLNPESENEKDRPITLAEIEAV